MSREYAIETEGHRDFLRRKRAIRESSHNYYKMIANLIYEQRVACVTGIGSFAVAAATAAIVVVVCLAVSSKSRGFFFAL